MGEVQDTIGPLRRKTFPRRGGATLPQRGNIIQPRVARHELPWVGALNKSSTPTGLHRSVAKVMRLRWGWDETIRVTQGSLADSATPG